MAEIQQFNLGQLLGQAEAIKGARRQNQLAELMMPIQQQSAQLGLQQARLGQTQQLAKGALAMMGGNWQDPDVWNRAITMAEQQGADVRPLKAGPTQEGYNLIQAYASGNQQALDAATRNFQFLTEGMTEQERLKARRIQLGLDPRAQGSGALTIATTPGATEAVAGSESQIAGSKAGAAESAKLTEQREQLPQLRAAIASAEAAAKQSAEISAEKRSNSRAFSTYETGMANLGKALGATTTGPAAGWLPAITADAQVAEGAAAVMAPILKSLFREAGEGTFTEGDQKLLMDMLPSRSDHPEAAKAKMKFIDDLVRQKLSAGPAQQAAPVQSPPTQVAPAAPSTQPAGGVRFLGFE